MIFFLVFFLVLVALAMIIGLTAMAMGGEFSKKYSNKMMRARIILQAIAIVIAMGLVYFASTSGGA